MQKLMVGATLVGVCAIWLSQISGSRITNDAAQNALMAINLRQDGVISLDEQPPLSPTMYREPLPIVVMAGAVGIIDAFLGETDAQEYLAGERVRFLKYSNVLWATLLWFGVFAATRLFTGSIPLALVVALLAVRPFSSSSGIEGVNNLYTELAAAALLLWSTLMVVVALKNRRSSQFAIAGICLGLLTLTKASFLYIVLGLFALLAPLYVLLRDEQPRLTRALHAAVVVALFATVVTPWMYRNGRTFDHFQITERGGVVLYIRALMNDMTAEEYRGTFYVWARPRLRWAVDFMAFSPRDLERGGRLQRLSDGRPSSFHAEDRAAEEAGRPEDAFTFYREGRAERVKVSAEFASQGHLHPTIAADRALQERALEKILGNVIGDLALSVPLIWRSAPIMFPFLSFAVIYGVLRKRYDLALFILPALAMLSFNALLTIFVPRYAVASLPTALVTAAVVTHMFWSSERVVQWRASALYRTA